jgi:hypothetical protein
MKLRIVDEVGFALDSITCDFFVYDQREGEDWLGQLHCIVICGIMCLGILSVAAL